MGGPSVVAGKPKPTLRREERAWATRIYREVPTSSPANPKAAVDKLQGKAKWGGRERRRADWCRCEKCSQSQPGKFAREP